MAITYPLAMPSTGEYASMRLRPRAAVAISESPFTFQQQVYAHQGGAWALDISLITLTRADAEPWLAFLLKLNGQEGTFLFGDPSATSPRGTPTGTPAVDGASQTGKTIDLKGFTNNSTGNYLEGDYIQLGSGTTTRLHKIMDASVDADGSGLSAAVNIWPRLRESPSDSAALVHTNANGTFRLAGSEMPWDVDVALHFGIDFAAVEAI